MSLPATLRKLQSRLSDAFWPVPALMSLMGVLLAAALVKADHVGVISVWLADGDWIYNGGATGARTLLGAIVSSTIGVAGTVYSITIAALSLAAGQMGPRLLRNFTRDRGVQATLGTFCYALMVLGSVRAREEGAFTPHLALTVGVLLAFVCLAMLIYFVGHMVGRINVDTVVDLVSEDLHATIRRLAIEAPHPAAPPESFWSGSVVVRDTRRGYLQQLDTAVRLLVRPGDYVFPGAPIARFMPAGVGTEQAAHAIREATALGAARVSAADLEYAVRQLVEVAVRALSPGINDPHTAISVLDRLGATLCDLVPVFLPSGTHEHEGRLALIVPLPDYDDVVDCMFHLIRQNAAASAAVLIRMIEVLTAVASCEGQVERRAALHRHADLVLADALRTVGNARDCQDVRVRHAAFVRVCTSA